MARIKSFSCGGQKITVKYVKKMKTNSDVGNFDPVTNTILILTEADGRKFAEDQIDHILKHEQCHLIMYIMNKFVLYRDETFVDLLAQFLVQIEKTKEH